MQDIIKEAEILHELMMNLEFTPQTLFGEWMKNYGIMEETEARQDNFSPLKDTCFLLKAMDKNKTE